MGAIKSSSNESSIKVEARLIRHRESIVLVLIEGAPVEIRQKRMPKTFEKQVAIIERASG